MGSTVSTHICTWQQTEPPDFHPVWAAALRRAAPKMEESPGDSAPKGTAPSAYADWDVAHQFPRRAQSSRVPVSYTHLTLPTICSV
eukprot:14187986-Alexandrium_andersonii.AAC.1